MARFWVRRITQAIFVLFAVITVVFLALRINGDPVTAALTLQGASQEQIAAVRHALGYDRPIIVQYFSFLGDLLRGDLGNSLTFGRSATEIFFERAPYTVYLALAAFAMTILVSIPVGALAALNEGKLIDRVIMFFIGIFQSTPNFVIGPILILIVAIQFKLLPVAGVSGPASIILPTITLATTPTARVARLLRGSMVEVRSKDYVTLATAKGLPRGRVVTSYIARNAMLPVLTILGLQLVGMVGGAVITETIFAWPGVGRLATDALLSSDFPLVQAIVILVAVAVVAINFLTDVAYAIADPRIQLNRRK